MSIEVNIMLRLKSFFSVIGRLSKFKIKKYVLINIFQEISRFFLLNIKSYHIMVIRIKIIDNYKEKYIEKVTKSNLVSIVQSKS